MVSKTLMGIWAFIDLCLLAAGAITVALSLVWRQPNLLMNMVFSKSDLTAGLILGISLMVTFFVSIAAIIQPNHVTMGLIILNWTLIVDALGIVIIGSFIWYYTLGERANFQVIFNALPTAQKIALQDQLKCCGYFGIDDSIVGGSFCQNSTFIQTTVNTTSNFCVTPITNFADSSLNLTFTTVYGFMAIVLSLFLASLCVIKVRKEIERFKKIDAKRGGRGFV